MNKDKIVIPEKYANIAKSLIDVFKEETFPNATLSEKTESALSSLFNMLLPEQAVKLDDYLDIELLLLAVYQAYRDNFGAFQDWQQRNAFCIRTMGLIHSVLGPETAKI